MAKKESEEADAASEYEEVTQENAVTKTTEDQSVKYKTQEAKGQDKTAARETTSAELSAVNDYHSKITDRCIMIAALPSRDLRGPSGEARCSRRVHWRCA